MKEVEMKCWITSENTQKIEEFLQTQTVFLGKKHKKDRNFCRKGGEQKIAFRLREESSENEKGESTRKKFWVTEKKKTLSENGVEINEELEFEVSSGEDFESFVESQGFEMFYQKEKKVEQYQQTSGDLSLLFEKLEVPGLGKFLEVEIVCEENFLELAEKKIFSFFQGLGLEKDIEKTPYVVLLGKGTVK